MTVRTDVDIALGVVCEGGAREHAISSFVPFPHWNIRRDVLAQEPGQHLARSIGGIGCEPGSRRCHLVLGGLGFKPNVFSVRSIIVLVAATSS